MSIMKALKPAAAVAAALLGVSLAAGTATATPLTSTKAAVDAAAQNGSAVQSVRWRRWGGHWGGFGFYGPSIYIGPGYGYGYGYYPRYSYYPYSYYDYGYYRPRYYGGYYGYGHRRWVQNRFRHPLGRR
jgi:hypothetical protein